MVNSHYLAAVYRFEIEQPFFEVLGSLRGTRVLDLGCGDGRYTVKMHERGAEIVGIDIDARKIEKAKQLCKPKLDFQVLDATSLAFEREFDIVTAMMMLNELTGEKLERVMHRVTQALREGGRFVFVIPHPAFMYREHTAITNRKGLDEFDYFHEGKPFTTSYQDQNKTVTVTDHHYSLGYITNQLCKNCLMIRSLIEPCMESKKERTYALIPYYLIIEAVKIGS